MTWGEIRATKVPPGLEAEAASSRDALRVALAMAESGRDAHVVGPGEGKGLSPWFTYALSGYVEALGGIATVAELAIAFPHGRAMSWLEARRTEVPVSLASDDIDVARRDD